MDKLYIVIPAYNEEANIETTIQQWYPIIEKHNGGGASKMVVVNDGSTDDTWKILCRLSESMLLLKPLTKKNGGHGSSVLYGYNYAVEMGADYVFQTDADGQTDPGEFEEFWNLRKDYDAVIGKRTIRGDGKARKFVENTVCLLLRLMKSGLVKKYIKKLPKNYNLPNIMMTTYFAYYHEKLCFREISFKPRQGGVNSINIKKIIKIGWNALRDFRKLKKQM